MEKKKSSWSSAKSAVLFWPPPPFSAYSVHKLCPNRNQKEMSTCWTILQAQSSSSSIPNLTGEKKEAGKWRGERESGQQGEQQQGPGGFGCSLPCSSWQWRWWCFFTILFLWDYIPVLTGPAPMTNSHAEGSTMAWKKVPLWWACLPGGKQNERHKQASCRFSVFQWHERLPFICLHRSQTER